MNLCKCKYAKPESDKRLTWHYVCRLTGQATDPYLCRSCERRNDGKLHWIDNADSYICPMCGHEVDSPARYEGCRCPVCGFQDPKDAREG